MTIANWKYLYFTLFFLASFFVTNSLFAQTNVVGIEKQRTAFQALSDNERIEKMSDWFNKSLNVEIPLKYKTILDEFCIQSSKSERECRKFSLHFNVLFNRNIPIEERGLAFELLQKDEEFPSDILTQIHDDLFKSINFK